MIRIHNFPRGARGVRAGWVCEEMGLDYEFAAVTYPPSEAFIRLNPLGTVPVLEDGAATITESLAIMLYLAEAHGPTPLLPPRDDPAFAQVLELAMFGEASLGASLNPLLAARFSAPAELKRNWPVGMLEGRVEKFLDHLSARLGENAYLVGSGLTLADICVETSLQIWQGALAGAIPDNLAAYRDRLKALETYQRAMAAQA